jgi:hypothetical protein
MTTAYHPNVTNTNDNRRVALIKSLATNNRFYALVTPESGIRNADTVESIPPEVLLGIAYPCLEDGLNDFAVIRTTYETLDYFPDDEAMRVELMEIINEARGKLVRRLAELRERLDNRRAHFLGTDLEEFRGYVLDIVNRGYPRRNLDSMMKLNVFSSVAEAEGHSVGSEPLYRYEFNPGRDVPALSQGPPIKFISELFGDVLDSVTDDANYESKYLFDRNVFQKFIAVMFVNYATTEPIFYGINRADYGVSDDKNMDSTPLYIAVARELREIEARIKAEEGGEVFVPADEAAAGWVAGEAPDVQLPGTLVNEDVLLSPIAGMCAAARQIMRKGDHEEAELARVVLAEASRLIGELKRLNIVSPFADDPGMEL